MSLIVIVMLVSLAQVAVITVGMWNNVSAKVTNNK